MFPGVGANVYRNEAGEPIGWDRPMSPHEEPYDPDDFLDWDEDEDDDDGDE